MAVEARKFPQEIERAFGDLPPPALAFLKTLSVKFEPFAVPLTNDPDQNDIRGFEMLAYGPGGASYGALLGQAKAAGVSEGVLGVALFKVALLSAEALAREMAGQVPGQVLETLVCTFNVNGAMLKESSFAKTLKAIQRPAYSVLLEASEDLTPADVKGLRDALDSREKWLGLALDDSDELAHDTRVLLENRVKLVKADGKYVRKLYRDKERAPEYMLSRLLELRKDRIPFVAEGVETEAMKHYLHDRWEVNAHSELWMQGYHISLPKPWSKVLRPLGRAAKKPKGYVLPATGETAMPPAPQSPPPADAPTGKSPEAASSSIAVYKAKQQKAEKEAVVPPQPDSALDSRLVEEIAAVLADEPLLLAPMVSKLRLEADAAVETVARALVALPIQEAIEDILVPVTRVALRRAGGLRGQTGRILWSGASAIFGWLCLKVANRGDDNSSLPAWKLNTEELFAVEAFVARSVPRPVDAVWTKGTPDIRGRGALASDEEGGWSDDRYQALLFRLFTLVWPAVKTSSDKARYRRLTGREMERLRDQLAAYGKAESGKTRAFYLALPESPGTADYVTLFTRLKADLPGLTIVLYQATSGASALLVPESAFLASVELFLEIEHDPRL